jgi:uncharacterized delta-60 repeat protein
MLADAVSARSAWREVMRRTLMTFFFGSLALVGAACGDKFGGTPGAPGTPDDGGSDDAGVDADALVGTPDVGVILTTDAAAPLFAIQGRTTTLALHLARRPGSMIPIRVTASGLPASVVAAPVDFASDASEGTMSFVVAGDAAQGSTTVSLRAAPADPARTDSTSSVNVSLFVRGKPGTLDPTFATKGVQPVLYGASGGDPLWSKIYPDGSILVGGTSLVKVMANGTPDPAFGVGGIAAATSKGVAFDVSSDLSKIYVLGSTALSGGYPKLSRFDAQGHLDGSFNATGSVAIDLGLGSAEPVQVSVLPTGKILVLGLYPSLAGGGLVISRWNADGSKDTSYGPSASGYCALLAAGSGGTFGAGRMVVRADGSAAVGLRIEGSAGGPNVGLKGCTAAGTPDPKFGSAPDYIKIVTSGTFETMGSHGATGYVMVFARELDVTKDYVDYSVVSDTGEVDQALAGGGVVNAFVGNGAWVETQPDGKVIVAGNTQVGNAFNWTLARFEPNGQPDLEFGDSGQVLLYFGVPEESQGLLQSIQLSADGRIYAVGSHFDVDDGAVARFWP